jgi:hypothetical protein
MKMSNEKLTIGLLLDSYEVPAWWYYALEQIVCADFAIITVVLKNNEDPQENTETWLSHLLRNRTEFAYEVLNKVDEKVFLREPIAAAKKNLLKIIAGFPVIKVKIIRDGNIDIIHSEDVQKIRNLNLDLLIKVGGYPTSGEITTAAKYGVWFYDHNNYRTKRGGPPGFWEVVEKWPDTGSTLLMANARCQDGWVVYQSRFFTYPFSPARNRNTSFWSAASFLPRQVELLYRFGEEKFYQETARFNKDFNYFAGRQYQTPSNLDSIICYLRLLFRNVFELYQRVFRLDTWYLMACFSTNRSLSFADFKKIMPPKDRFWADPQIIIKDKKIFIFVEEFLYKNLKGHIAVIEIDSQGNYQESVPVLETNYHLSFPFVFEYEHEYYMVPESAQNHTIDLYKCVEFPLLWKHQITLMKNVIAVDTTLFFYSGKWWLFTGIAQTEGALPEVELCIFSSAELFTTNWQPHPLNPVVSDVRCARPAGKLFLKDGKLYRPSQDCSKTYGYGFNINEIMCLSETEYLEKMVTIVKPNWDRRLIATHTFTRAEGITIIDGLIRRSKLF